MKKIFVLSTLFALATLGYSQKIHSTSEIFKTMNDSKLMYKINSLVNPIVCKDFSNKLNQHSYYRVKKDSTLETREFSITGNVKYLYDQAEKLFGERKLDQACVYYQMTLKNDSTLSNVMTYIGQIYENKRDFNEAMIWYKKAIQNNYIDYMAHWFLADAYMTKNDQQKAEEEITIAQILNRNNIRIRKSKANIFLAARRDTSDWYFNPQVAITESTDKSISVSADAKWFGFAMAKALWLHEPGYRESMGVAKGEISFIENRECLATLVTALENGKTKISNDPQLQVLRNAALDGYLDEYIWYEIILPERPFVAYQLPEETILRIKDYILKYRNPKEGSL